jgi:hypothetical protein
MANFEQWTLVLILIALVIPRGIATRRLQSVRWYQLKFPLLVGDDRTTTGRRFNDNILHWFFFSGVSEAFIMVFFLAGWFYYLYNLQNATYYNVINAMSTLFVLFVAFLPWFMVNTDSHFYHADTAYAVGKLDTGGAAGAGLEERGAKNTPRRRLFPGWQMGGWPPGAILFPATLAMALIIVDFVLIIVEPNPAITTRNSYMVSIFWGIAMLGTLISLIHVGMMVGAKTLGASGLEFVSVQYVVASTHRHAG